MKAMNALLAALLAAGAALAQDKEGSKDHPLMKRYPGATIRDYVQKEFDEAELPAGKLADSEKFDKTVHVEGKITAFYYDNPENRSVLEIFRNHESALKAAGFQTIFSCAQEACGDGRPPADAFAQNWNWTSSQGGQRHLTAKLARAAGDAYVDLHVMAYGPQQSWTSLRIVEVKPIESGLVEVNTGALAEDIGRTGHVAVYGIHFDTGKADLKPESDATLGAIGKLLAENPSLKLHVVGHTDNVGKLPDNLDLSNRRAQAVVKALTTKYKVAAVRLSPSGVGSLSPVATNRTDEGRAKNRRVELVEQ